MGDRQEVPAEQRVRFGSWTVDDWVRHYAGPRWSGRAEPGSAWDAEGRRVPGEMVRVAGQPMVLTAGEVIDRKADLDARYGRLADEMAACTLLDEAEREAFDGLVGMWRGFFCGGQPDGRREPHVEVVGIAAQMNDCDRYECELAWWQERLAEHRASGENEEDRAEKKRKPVLIAAAALGALYFFGPSIRRELFSPVVIQKDFIAERRQRALDMGYPDVSIDAGKGMGSDLASQVGDVLSAGRRPSRGVVEPEPPEVPRREPRPAPVAPPPEAAPPEAVPAEAPAEDESSSSEEEEES